MEESKENNESKETEISTPTPTPTSPYKYGYVTVEHATEEILFEDVWRYFGYEHIIASDKIIVDFTEDLQRNIYDADKVEYNDIVMDELTFDNRLFPFYFKDTGKFRIYMRKMPTVQNSWFSSRYKLDILPIFQDYKYNTLNPIPSIYNCIYTHGRNNVFSIIKIKQSRERDNFLVAYNPEYMEEKAAVSMLKDILRTTCRG